MHAFAYKRKVLHRSITHRPYTDRISQPYRTTRGRLDEAYSDKEVSVAVHSCTSFARKIAVVVDNYSLLVLRTSDVVEGNISPYLLENDPYDNEGRVVVNRLLLQGVDVENISSRGCNELRWDPVRSDDWLPRRPRHLCIACRQGCRSNGALGGSA